MADLSKLKQLKELFDSGALTEEEYQAEKQTVMIKESSTDSVTTPWNKSQMTLYLVFSFFLPLIGVVAGIYGWATGRHRQGEKLLMAAFLGVVFYIALKSF